MLGPGLQESCYENIGAFLPEKLTIYGPVVVELFVRKVLKIKSDIIRNTDVLNLEKGFYHPFFVKTPSSTKLCAVTILAFRLLRCAA